MQAKEKQRRPEDAGTPENLVKILSIPAQGKALWTLPFPTSGHSVMRGTRSLLEAEASSGSQWKMGCHGSAPPSPLTLAVLLEGTWG